jgi:hypothetical protein
MAASTSVIKSVTSLDSISFSIFSTSGTNLRTSWIQLAGLTDSNLFVQSVTACSASGTKVSTS